MRTWRRFDTWLALLALLALSLLSACTLPPVPTNSAVMTQGHGLPVHPDFPLVIDVEECQYDPPW
ncbi:MAG TPA: hypothetical protein VF040_21760 [Ktedonobacterales bacterium]